MNESFLGKLRQLARDNGLALVAALVALAVLLTGGSVWWSLLILALVIAAVWHSLGAARIRRESINRLSDAAFRLADGTTVDYRITATAELEPLTNAMNRMLAEVTGRQSQLGELANRLTTVLGAMMEGVLAVDERQRILFANGAAGRLLGFDPNAAQGKMLLEVVRNHMLHEAIAEALAHRETPDQETQRYEFDSHRSRGQILSFRASRLHGEPCPGVVLVLQDVTDLRRLENLRQEFIANVSHELKTPLSAIKAYAETLQSGAIDDPSINRKFTANIESEAERLNVLIAKMLQLAKIESGHEPFEVVPVEVYGAVQKCIEQHAPLAIQKQLSLRVVEFEDYDLRVLADRDGLATILNNLVENAIKYTSQGGEIVVRYAAESDNNVRIEVRDSGIGIPPELQSRVFERFYRVDSARSRDLGSTGLGLAIVKHLAATFGGSISVYSEIDQGSTFQVLLPRALTKLGAAK